MGYGFKGFIGVALEVSGGTPVAAAAYHEAMSEDLALNQDRYDVRNIHGKFSEPDDCVGIQRIGGSVVIPGNPEDLGYYLLGAMGVQSNTEVLSGFLHHHEFTMQTADWDTKFPQRPLTFEVNRDVTSSQQYSGINVSAINIENAPNQDLRLSATLVGKSGTQIAATTPTFVNSPTCPFAFDTASISIAGSANDKLEAFQLSIDNQLEGVATLNASNEISRIRRTGPQMVRLSGTMVFEDIDEYNDFLNQTERAIVMNFNLAASYQLLIDIPRFVYDAFPTGTPGRDRHTVGFSGRARYHSGSAASVKVDLYNTTSGY